MSNNRYNYQNSGKPLKLKLKSGAEQLHYPTLYEGTPEEFKRNAEKELNETEEKKVEGLRILREIAEKHHLNCPDEIYLIAILRYCKYETKKYESILKHFTKIRREGIAQLKKMNTKKIEKIVDDAILNVLPYRNEDGSMIVLTQPNLHLDVYTMEDAISCFLAFFLFLLTYPMTSICGLTYVGDCKCSSQFYLFCVLQKYIHPLISKIINLPMRYRKVYIVQESILFRWFYSAVAPFLPAKFKKRITCCGENLKKLQIHQHPDLLPNEFGGNLGFINNTFYRQKFLNFIQKLKDESQ